VIEVARQYSNLEYNLGLGERGSRHDHTARLAAELTGAEDAVIINNNAAAILLTLSALASKSSVIVSRGELVEIGGNFRIPEILELSGATLIEVGATNRTHTYDYEKAIKSDVSAILKVHRSNFAMVGFTSELDRKELVEICTKHQKLFVEDLGSGCLLYEKVGGQTEPTAQEAIKAGVDVVTISGDKLLGGPQAGIILGRKDLLAKIKKHPLARAVRVDKMTLAALEATLMLYRDKKPEELPVWTMFRASQESLLLRAQSLAARLSAVCSQGQFIAEAVIERVGGGALPLSELPGAAVSCRLQGQSAQTLEKRLRRANLPIITRIENDRVYLHLRTILPYQECEILLAFISTKNTL
jgi:L-seryl-tRNA(Ser) seleniumtransferase